MGRGIPTKHRCEVCGYDSSYATCEGPVCTARRAQPGKGGQPTIIDTRGGSSNMSSSSSSSSSSRQYQYQASFGAQGAYSQK